MFKNLAKWYLRRNGYRVTRRKVWRRKRSKSHDLAWVLAGTVAGGWVAHRLNKADRDWYARFAAELPTILAYVNQVSQPPEDFVPEEEAQQPQPAPEPDESESFDQRVENMVDAMMADPRNADSILEYEAVRNRIPKTLVLHCVVNAEVVGETGIEDILYVFWREVPGARDLVREIANKLVDNKFGVNTNTIEYVAWSVRNGKTSASFGLGKFYVGTPQA